MATRKATAPASSLSDAEFHQMKPLGQRFSEWRRGRRAQRLSRPKRPVHIHLGTNGQSASSSPPRRRRRATRLPRGHTYNRRRPKRGTLAAVLGLTVAAIAVTAAVVEFATWEAATELGTLAEMITLGTAYAFGEPSDKAKLKQAQQAGQAPKPPRQRKPAQPPARSAGHKCGAPTQDGSACNRPVKNASDSCWEHPGGKGTGTKKTTAGSNSGPKRTKSRGAAPPAPVPPQSNP
jgi:hypothetical protein